MSDKISIPLMLLASALLLFLSIHFNTALLAALSGQLSTVAIVFLLTRTNKK